MITLHWQWLVFIPVVLVLGYLTFIKNDRPGMFSGLDNLLWGIALIIFILIWGGIFWW